jgi:hypothetical protein
LALVLVGVALFAGLGLAQYFRQQGDSVVEEVSTVRALPTVADLAALRRAGELGRGRLPTSDSAAVPPDLVGTLELDLHLGEFEIVPGQPGEGVKVTGTYEPDAFRLTEELEERDDGSWSYRLSFRPRGGMLGMMFTGAGNNPQNRLTISLPPDRPFDLVGEWGIGEMRAELGGLWIRDIGLDLGTGSHAIGFSQPTRGAMSEFNLQKGIGELEVAQLGNASPASTTIEQRIGELTVDLGGAWAGDAEVVVNNSLGEVVVVAPRDVRVERVDESGSGVGDSSWDLPDDSELPADAPTLRLSVRAGVGEVRVRAADPRQDG